MELMLKNTLRYNIYIDSPLIGLEAFYSVSQKSTLYRNYPIVIRVLFGGHTVYLYGNREISRLETLYSLKRKQNNF